MVSRTRIIALVIGFFLFAGTVLVVYVKQRPGIRSIAVIPFEVHRSSDRSLVPSGEAIARNLTTMLTQGSDLEVVPMVSSKQFADQADALVEGSIQEEGSRLVVKVTIHDTEGDRRLWSEELKEPAGDPVYVEHHLASVLAPLIIKAIHDPDAPTDLRLGFDPEADRMIDRGWGLLQEDDSEADRRAGELFHEALMLDPGHTNGYMGLALVAYRRGGPDDFTESIRLFERTLRLDEDLMAPRRGLAKNYWFLGQFENCLALTLQIPPTTPRLERLILLGEAYCLCGLPDKAIPVLEEARRLDPDDPGILWALVAAYTFSSEPRKSIEAGLEFLSDFDDNLFIHEWVAEGYHALGVRDSAAIHYEAASANELAGSAALINLAGLYRQAGDEDRARDALSRYIEMATDVLAEFPDRINARAILALAYALAGDRENHARLGETVELEAQTNGLTYWAYGISLAVLGRDDEALSCFRKALAMKANFYQRVFGKADSGLGFWAAPHLADNPEFRAFVEEAHRDLDRLRSKY